jgi:hypothetical protein
MTRALEQILEVWDRFELAPIVVVDRGESLIVLGATQLHFTSSGVELENQVAQLLTIERGLVTHERDFFRWDDALRAAGLDPTSLDLPGTRPVQ